MTRAVPLAALAAATLVVGSPARAQSDVPVGFALGPAEASLVVIEFADFACSACAEFARDTWPEVRARYVDSGRVRWIVVPFKLGFRNSDEGARAAYCAAEEERFWPMHDALFAERGAWVGERRPHDALAAIAASAGLDAALFARCYDDHDRTERAIDDANRAARAAGVRATPTFLIGGVPVQGALPVEAFAGLLDAALAGGRPGGPS